MTASALPCLTLAWTAWVEIGERQALGATPLGERYRVDIVGGRFEGPRLRGRVLPGGADRQLLRPDGVKLLDAVYDMQTDEGAVLTVHNRVLVDEAAATGRYARSVVQVTAPTGPHAWLNRRVFVGTLQRLVAAQPTVRVDVYLLD